MKWKNQTNIEMPVVVKQKQKPINKKVGLPRLRTRLLDHDTDEFWNYVQVLLLYITSFISYIFFANIVLATYSLKQDVKMPR
jgi:uncharacterized protein YdaL